MTRNEKQIQDEEKPTVKECAQSRTKHVLVQSEKDIQLLHLASVSPWEDSGVRFCPTSSSPTSHFWAPNKSLLFPENKFFHDCTSGILCLLVTPNTALN